MRIGITGVGGFVGSVLAKELVKQGHEVKGLVHNGKFPLDGVKITTVKGNILDKNTMMDFFKDVDVAIHTAAVISLLGDPTGIVHKVNVLGTRNVVESCVANNIKQLVHFSSIHAMKAEPHDQTLDETRELVGTEAFHYDQSKANGEREVHKGAEQGLNCIIISPTGIFGPMDAAPSPVGKNLLDLYHGRLPALINGGYDFVDVRDVVSATLAAMEKGGKLEKYLIGGGYTKLRNLADAVERTTGKKGPRFTFPSWVQWIGLPFVLLFAKLTGREPIYTNETIEIITHGENISSEKAKRELGYSPHTLDETMKDAFAWFRENGYLTK